jgi:2'-5' RNA ligase
LTQFTDVTDHWWWRPGWSLGKRFYTWHFTFERNKQLNDYVAHFQNLVAKFPCYDIVPLEWLHLTTQGINFVDQVPKSSIDSIVSKVRERLSLQPPLHVAFGKPELWPESISFPVSPIEAIAACRTVVREAIEGELGTVEGKSDDFYPHVSLAYSNSVYSASKILKSLEENPLPEIQLELSHVDLIRLGRDRKIYEWEVESRIAFSGH